MSEARTRSLELSFKPGRMEYGSLIVKSGIWGHWD